MKKYILLGSNNFWYSLDTSLKRIKKEAKEILKEYADVRTLDYSDPESDYHPYTPNSITIYEVKEVEELQRNTE